MSGVVNYEEPEREERTVVREERSIGGTIRFDERPIVQEQIVEERVIKGNIIVDQRAKEKVVDQNGVMGVIRGVEHPQRQDQPVTRKPSVLEVVAVNNNTSNYHRQQQRQLSNNSSQMLQRQQSLNHQQQQLQQMHHQQEMEDLYTPSYEVTEELVGVDPDLTDARRAGNQYKVRLNLTSLLTKTTRPSTALSRPVSSRMVHSPLDNFNQHPSFHHSTSVVSPSRTHTDTHSNMYTPSVFDSAPITPQYNNNHQFNLSPYQSISPNHQYNTSNNFNHNYNNSIIVPFTPNNNEKSTTITRQLSTNLGFDISLDGLDKQSSTNQYNLQQNASAQIQVNSPNNTTSTKTTTTTYSNEGRSGGRVLNEEEFNGVSMPAYTDKQYGTVPACVYEEETYEKVTLKL